MLPPAVYGNNSATFMLTDLQSHDNPEELNDLKVLELNENDSEAEGSGDSGQESEYSMNVTLRIVLIMTD